MPAGLPKPVERFYRAVYGEQIPVIDMVMLTGRGACDMKAGLCAGIFAIQALQQLGYRPARDVLVESVIGEESGGVGTLTTIIKGFTAEAVILLEPTCLEISPVQSGALTFRLIVPGCSIHDNLSAEKIA